MVVISDEGCVVRAGKEVATWNAKCDKAERALAKAQKRFNEAPDDATKDELDAIRKKLNAAQGKVQELYFNLPYSLDDVSGEFYAKLRVEEMVAEGEVTPTKRERMTADQVAEVVNRYLSMRHGLVIVDHVYRYNRHEWEIQETVGYDIPNEDIPAHNEIVGRIWVDVQTKKGEVTGWTMGYGLAKNELRLTNKFRLATVFRGAVRAVDNEFHLSKKWDDFAPVPRRVDKEFSGYGRQGGTPAKASYNRAYNRIMDEGMSRKESFRHYLEEKNMANISVRLRGEKWRAFKKAMAYRKQKRDRK